MQRYARPILVVLFLLMLATPALIRRFGAAGPTAAEEDPQPRYGFRLTEVSAAAGLDCVRVGPALDR